LTIEKPDGVVCSLREALSHYELVWLFLPLKQYDHLYFPQKEVVVSLDGELKHDGGLILTEQKVDECHFTLVRLSRADYLAYDDLLNALQQKCYLRVLL